MPMTTSEAARFLGVAAQTIKAWTDKGLIPVHRSTVGWRYYEEKDLFKALAQHKKAAAKARGGRI